MFMDESIGATVMTSSAKPLGLLLRTVSCVGCVTSMKPRFKSAPEISRSEGADRSSILATARTVAVTARSEWVSRAPAAVTLAATISAIRAVLNP